MEDPRCRVGSNGESWLRLWKTLGVCGWRLKYGASPELSAFGISWRIMTMTHACEGARYASLVGPRRTDYVNCARALRFGAPQFGTRP